MAPRNWRAFVLAFLAVPSGLGAGLGELDVVAHFRRFFTAVFFTAVFFFVTAGDDQGCCHC